jgi:putative transposase
MPSTPQGYRRRNSLRHVSFDYSQPAAYFVTLCCHKGQTLFGHIRDGTMLLNPLGEIADRVWHEFAERHPETELDAFVVMPNHVHVLLWILPPVDATAANAPKKERQFGDAIAGSLSTLIGGYKSAVTQKAKLAGLVPGPQLWQRNFYDHIVRNEPDLLRIRAYIHDNPARWHEDKLHPDRPPNEYNRTWHSR